MTDTVFGLPLVTWKVFVVGLTATPMGYDPTEIVVVTSFVSPLIIDMPVGAMPTGIVLPGSAGLVSSSALIAIEPNSTKSKTTSPPSAV